MNNFALLIFKRDSDVNRKKNIFKRIFELIFKKFKKPDIPHWLEKLTIADDIYINTIRIPYTLDEFMTSSENRREKLFKCLKNICNDNNLESCILPSKLYGIFPSDNMFVKMYTGQLLYRALLPEIIKEISKLKQFDINAIEIAVIHGEDYEMAFGVIKLLSSFIKYITIFTEDEYVKKGIDEIYYETGSSIGISSDLPNTVKRSDIIINMRVSAEFNQERFKKGGVIINYGKTTQVFKKVCTINGIKVSLPEFMEAKMRDDILALYNSCELAEIFICYESGYTNFKENPKIDLNLSQKLSSVFVKEGYK
ncbi:MAG: hypothetical protein Q8942_11475, partial [Bacillota bacterium]|nr:hypothetical protein [Bacillota bacterium]